MLPASLFCSVFSGNGYLTERSDRFSMLSVAGSSDKEYLRMWGTLILAIDLTCRRCCDAGIFADSACVASRRHCIDRVTAERAKANLRFACIIAALLGALVAGLHTMIKYVGCPLGTNGCNSFSGQSCTGPWLGTNRDHDVSPARLRV